MGAEVGATTSTFPYSDNMRNYLHATGRGPVADAADRAAGAGFLEADQGAEYDEVIEIVRSSTSHLLCHHTLSSDLKLDDIPTVYPASLFPLGHVITPAYGLS